MDAETNRLDLFPRNLFFQAVDYQVGPAALPESEVKVMQNKRFADVRRLHTQLEHLSRAVKAVESFDHMGNAGLAAVNLEDVALDVHKQIRNFITTIEAAEDRYGDAIEEPAKRDAAGVAPGDVSPPVNSAAVVESTPKAPAAADHQPALSVVKPGPHLVAVATMGRNRAGR